MRSVRWSKISGSVSPGARGLVNLRCSRGNGSITQSRSPMGPKTTIRPRTNRTLRDDRSAVEPY